MFVLGMLLRLYSYLFGLILSLFALGLAAVAIMSDGGRLLNLEMLPWKGQALTFWLLGIGIAGLVSLGLAVVGKMRLLFVLFCLAAFALTLRGYFLGAYMFSGRDEFHKAALLVFGALLASFGALFAEFSENAAQEPL